MHTTSLTHRRTLCLKSEMSEQLPWTCNISNGQQEATPLVVKRCPSLSPDFLPHWTFSCWLYGWYDKAGYSVGLGYLVFERATATCQSWESRVCSSFTLSSKYGAKSEGSKRSQANVLRPLYSLCFKCFLSSCSAEKSKKKGVIHFFASG